MGFSFPEVGGCFWCMNVQLCQTPCDIMNCSPPGSSVHGKNIEVGFHFLPQGIFLTEGWNPCLSCIGRWILYH